MDFDAAYFFAGAGREKTGVGSRNRKIARFLFPAPREIRPLLHLGASYISKLSHPAPFFHQNSLKD
jgi:hypothetical protein